MGFTLDWKTPNNLHISLYGSLVMDEMIAVNNAISHELASSQDDVILSIDISNLVNLPSVATRLQSTQKYTRNPHLKWIIVCGTNKMMRLSMMVLFMNTNAMFETVDTLDDLENYVERVHTFL